MRRTVSAMLAAAVFCSAFVGCSDSSAVSSQPAQTEITTTEQAAESTTVPSTELTTAPAAELTTAPATELTTAPATESTAASEVQTGSFRFNPKACSKYMEEVFGETMCQTWYNMVDAIMAGEETFACPDQFTYDWVSGQFPHLCLPPVQDLFYAANEGVKDGVAHITYTVSKEELKKQIDRFAETVESILNETVRPEDSDFEKMLELYIYFADHYTYDYELAQHNTDANALSVCHVFYDKTGICQELSQAYSLLLMQLGIDATVMSGSDHRWSYVRLKGKNYHIDPTFVLETHDLAYFLMTDAQRKEKGGYRKEDFVVTSCYTQIYDAPHYRADDETFTDLSHMDYMKLDRDLDLVFCKDRYAVDSQNVCTFSYAGY